MKLNMWQRRFGPVVVATVAVVLPLTACQSSPASSASGTANGEADALDRVIEAGVLRVANPQTSPPYSFRDDADQLQGFDVDFANEIGERMNLEIEFIQGEFDTFIPGLQTNRWDIVIAGQAITEERRRQVDFSIPYRVSAVTIFLGADDASQVTDLNDLSGKRIAVLAGSSDLERAESVPGAKLVTYENATLALSDLGRGRVDAYIGSRFAGTYFAEKYGLAVKATDVELAMEQNAMSMVKGANELREEMNRLTLAMIEDGTIAELSEKWFGPGEDVTDDVRELAKG